MSRGINTICSDALRGCIIAAADSELVVADWSNIESRVLAWLAEETWKLEAYRAKDRGDGVDLYSLLFSQFFGIPIDTVLDNQRQAGKVCLSGETLVLCRTGWKRLDSVTTEDEVWDGCSWTKHSGLVCNGLKSVVGFYGVSLTPDHLVWSGEKWMRADTLAASGESILFQTLVAAAENLPLRALSPGLLTALPASLCVATVAKLNTWWIRIASKVSYLRDAISAQKQQPGLREKLFGNTPERCRTTITEDASLIDSPQRLDGVLHQPIKGGQTTGDEVLEFASHGEKISVYSFNMFKRLKGGISPHWAWTGKIRTAIMRQVTSALFRAVITRKTNAKSAPSNQNVRVYDLLSVGSRNRFTILSAKGPLLVHNCELAFGFGGGVGALVTMAAAYNMDLDALPAMVLPNAKREHITKATTMWRKAFLNNEDFGLEPSTYIACDVLKQVYRESNKGINSLRHEVDDATKNALKLPGTSYRVAKCLIWADKDWLIVQLPSGRRLLYAKPKLEQETEIDPESGRETVREHISYMVARGKSWFRNRAWSGLFVENIVQAVANDVLRTARLLIQKEYETRPEFEFVRDIITTPIVLSVHDEVVCELPKGLLTLPQLIAWMTTGIGATNKWLSGLPLAAAGWVGPRYKKG